MDLKASVLPTTPQRPTKMLQKPRLEAAEVLPRPRLDVLMLHFGLASVLML